MTLTLLQQGQKHAFGKTSHIILPVTELESGELPPGVVVEPVETVVVEVVLPLDVILEVVVVMVVVPSQRVLRLKKISSVLTNLQF